MFQKSKNEIIFELFESAPALRDAILSHTEKAYPLGSPAETIDGRISGVVRGHKLSYRTGPYDANNLPVSVTVQLLVDGKILDVSDTELRKIQIK